MRQGIKEVVAIFTVLDFKIVPYAFKLYSVVCHPESGLWGRGEGGGVSKQASKHIFKRREITLEIFFAEIYYFGFFNDFHESH